MSEDNDVQKQELYVLTLFFGRQITIIHFKFSDRSIHFAFSSKPVLAN